MVIFQLQSFSTKLPLCVSLDLCMFPAEMRSRESNKNREFDLLIWLVQKTEASYYIWLEIAAKKRSLYRQEASEEQLKQTTVILMYM